VPDMEVMWSPLPTIAVHSCGCPVMLMLQLSPLSGTTEGCAVAALAVAGSAELSAVTHPAAMRSRIESSAALGGIIEFHLSTCV
jgi:hypothetical protein